MALRLLLLPLLLLLARAAGDLQCKQCGAKFHGVCLGPATTCTTASGQVCGSAKFSLGKLAVFSRHGCVALESCRRNSSELPLGARLELSCCNTTLCNAAAPRRPPPPPALALGALLGLWWPLR